MRTPDAVKRLVETFDRNLASYRTPAYNETQLRRDFLDPFFEALGWDVANRKGYDQRYREVVHEDAVKVGGTTKAPDYCFRVGGVRKFFVEAKAPVHDIARDPKPAFQLRRYAWTAKLPVSILTDFEEFSVYDTRVRPTEHDKAGAGRLRLIPYREYEQTWEELVNTFSPEAIQQGAFDRFVESGRKRGTTPVDAEFLKDIERWRDILARNIALRNSRLTDRQLNTAVQRTIDRIIFLRICEDRGIEPADTLRTLTEGERIYPKLFELFRRADERYNSGLFHFSQERGREEPDDLTPRLKVDDAVLKTIIGQLYYPSPYEFSVFPADILGQVYEQFLGKVIRLTAGHRAKVEDKPEVRKAGGVYYTPTYIVDYIVKNTVGKLLEKKTPAKASQLRILDPACGSGSFLLGAYQYLLDWHRDHYVKAGPGKHRDELYEGPGGEWRLTTQEKKRILLNNIYGVDIDAQAVEVTKLSLLLKVLEGESEQTITLQQKMFRERALPDLSSNIKCGNSLIGSDFWQGEQQTMFDDEEERLRINAFDWEHEFPDIIKAGGFDAVIGNPPYVFGRDWSSLGIPVTVKAYLGKRYRSSPYQLDMFSLFMERASMLCRVRGRIGQIVPNIWLTNTFSSATRSYHLSHSDLLTIAVPKTKVFPRLTVDIVVYVLRRNAGPGKTIEVVSLTGSSGINPISTLTTSAYLDGQRPLSTAQSATDNALVLRVRGNCPCLGDVAVITRGVHPYRTGGYGRSAFGQGPQTLEDVASRPYHREKPARDYRPFVYGRDLRRFGVPTVSDYVKYGPWLAEPRDPTFFEGPRVYSRKILGSRLVATCVDDDSVADQQVYITKPRGDGVPAAFLTGILGSRFVSYFIRVYYDEVNDAFPQVKVGQLRALPIPPLVGPYASRHDKMVKLVEQMLDLNKKLPKAEGAAKTGIERQIAATDKQIDALVYELYGLTEKEIRIVEGATQVTQR